MSTHIDVSVSKLLKPLDDVPLVSKAGYFDVLGDHDPIGPHRGQQVFRRKLLSLIYERIWRPIVTRFFFGLVGLGAAKERRLTLDALDISRGDRALDVGCGPGNYTRDLASASESGPVVGIDASEAMVAAAAKRGGAANLTYFRADAAALPFRDGAFDAACSVGVIHMVEEPEAAIGEMTRVLAPGGRLVIMASCTPPGRPRRVRGGVTFFTRDELTGALRERGLVEVDRRLFRRCQIVSARKPEDPIGR
jgi:SAM-dependent methyltransferase